MAVSYEFAIYFWLSFALDLYLAVSGGGANLKDSSIDQWLNFLIDNEIILYFLYLRTSHFHAGNIRHCYGIYQLLP